MFKCTGCYLFAIIGIPYSGLPSFVKHLSSDLEISFWRTWWVFRKTIFVILKARVGCLLFTLSLFLWWSTCSVHSCQDRCFLYPVQSLNFAYHVIFKVIRVRREWLSYDFKGNNQGRVYNWSHIHKHWYCYSQSDTNILLWPWYDSGHGFLRMAWVSAIVIYSSYRQSMGLTLWLAKTWQIVEDYAS